MNGRAYVASFNFKGSDQQKKVGDLSGGERNRVHLAKMLRRGGNVLLLDEPTNDLDVDTLRALEDALDAFPGCAVVISHDRWFLDRIATHVLAFEGDSEVRWFEGNFSDYEAFRRKELGAEAERPAPHQVQAAGADLSRPAGRGSVGRDDATGRAAAGAGVGARRRRHRRDDRVVDRRLDRGRAGLRPVLRGRLRRAVHARRCSTRPAVRSTRCGPRRSRSWWPSSSADGADERSLRRLIRLARHLER